MGYLTVLFDSVLFTDVVKRHNVRFVAQIDSLATYLVNNVAQEYSMRTLARVLGFMLRSKVSPVSDRSIHSLCRLPL